MPSQSGGRSASDWVQVIVAAMIFTAFTMFDKKIYLDQQARKLKHFGLELRSNDDIPDEFENAWAALATMKPTSLAFSVERAGRLKGASRKTFAGVAGVPAGNNSNSWVFIVIEADLGDTRFAIGKSQSNDPEEIRRIDIGHPAFENTRAAWFRDDPEDRDGTDTVERCLRTHADVFEVDAPSRMSLRLSAPPHAQEQWAYSNGFLAYANLGRPTEGPLVDGLEFVTRVAERLERSAARTS